MPPPHLAAPASRLSSAWASAAKTFVNSPAGTGGRARPPAGAHWRELARFRRLGLDAQRCQSTGCERPTTGEHCFVQVKSQTNRTTFRNLVDALDNSQGYSRMFFVYHTPEIARQAVRVGLTDWILSRTT